VDRALSQATIQDKEAADSRLADAMNNEHPPDKNSDRDSILRSAGVMTMLTLLSRVFGLIREQIRALFLGTGMASDAFGIASVIPNMFRRLLAEGAMTAAFVPVFAEFRQKHSREEMNAFLSQFITFFSFIVTGVTILGVLATPLLMRWVAPSFADTDGKLELTILLTQIMWPYLTLVSLAAIVQAILNSFRIFAPSAFTPVLLNLAIIGTVLLFHDMFEEPSHAFAWGFGIGGIGQLVFQLPYLRGLGLRLRPMFKFGAGVRKVAILFIPGAFAAGIYQVNVLVAQFVASGLAEGGVSSLQYSLRLQELVLGVFAVSITTVILPVMSDQVVRRDHEALKDTLQFSTGIIGFITIPASIGLLLLATPIIRVLFEFGEFSNESTAMTSLALVFHAAGIFPIAWSRIVTQTFYSMQDLKTPTMVAAGVMVFHAGLCFALAEPLQQGGIALAGGIAAIVNGLLLWWILRKRLGALGTGALIQSLLRTTIAAIAMGVVISLGADWLAIDEASSRGALALSITALILAGAAVYATIAWLLRAPELQEAIALIRSRKMPTRKS